MSQDMTIRVNFETEAIADIAADLLAKVDRLVEVQNGDEPEQVMFDACLSGIYRKPHDFWEGVLKPVIGVFNPTLIEFGIPGLEYVEVEIITQEELEAQNED